MSINIEALNNTIKLMRMHREKFDMEHWLDIISLEELPVCETVGCSAGFVILANQNHHAAIKYFEYLKQIKKFGTLSPEISVPNTAAQILHLSPTEARLLFTPWIDLMKVTANDAIETLERFRDTGLIEYRNHDE